MKRMTAPNVERLRKRLEKRGAQALFARRLGCKEGLVSKWRTGGTKPGTKWRIAMARQGFPISGWDA